MYTYGSLQYYRYSKIDFNSRLIGIKGYWKKHRFVIIKNIDCERVFFVPQLECAHQVHYHDRGDFIVDDTLVFEVGGASKDESQLRGQKGYIVADDLEVGFDNKIPLWLMDFLY